jgi:signal transduction histidine kinase
MPPIDPELLAATFSADGSPRFRNRAWERVLGRTSDPWSTLEEDDRVRATELVQEAGRGELATGQLFLLPGPPGMPERPVLLSFLPAHGDAPDSIAAVVVTGEVLEQPDSWTESQTDRHRMETLGRMTMGIAHDFNNLLSGILGHAELMQGALGRSIDIEALEEHVQTIQRAANDGGALIRKIQQYIRQEKETSFAPVDLPGLVQDCIVLTRPYWYNEPRRQGIAISVEQDLRTVPAISGSASELRDVLVNLILNAVHAMEAEGGLITFRTWVDGPQVLLSVSDTGSGMTKAVQQEIFKPLYTTKEHGTGMGLAVAYGVIQEHGGRIAVESTPGAGTQFTVEFPTATTESVRPETKTDAGGSERPLRILVVDDESMVRTVLGRLLGLRGHTVVDVGSGPDGLACLAEQQFDAVITDHGMPDMSGREFARRVGESHPGIPVILLTGDTHAGKPEGSIVAVLAKPFRLDDIDEVLKAHV